MNGANISINLNFIILKLYFNFVEEFHALTLMPLTHLSIISFEVAGLAAEYLLYAYSCMQPVMK
jgi:hypothetical protein